MYRRTLLLSAGLLLLLVVPTAAQEPTWSGEIIARGEQRMIYQSTAIVNRPYRPFHFYGNTIRRQYYRGRGPATSFSAPVRFDAGSVRRPAFMRLSAFHGRSIVNGQEIDRIYMMKRMLFGSPPSHPANPLRPVDSSS